jgi:hypothetical protein
MGKGCDIAAAALREFAEGARDLESFARAMKKRFGKDLKPDVLNAAFNKAADKYVAKTAPIDAIKLELAQELAKSRRSGVFETVTAYRKAGLLTSPRTTLRNLVGNSLSLVTDEISRIPASLVDMALSRFTGQRTILGPDFQSIRQGISSAVTKGLKDSVQVLKTGATPSDLAKYDVPRELNAYLGNKELTGLNWFVNYTNRLQGAIDKPFREYAFMRSLVEQAQLAARAEKVTGGAFKTRVETLVKSPTEAMLLKAVADSEEAVFANSNIIVDEYSKWKGRMAERGVFGKGTVFTADFLIPFVRVPSNIGGRIVESTPLSGIKLAVLLKQGLKDPEVQREFSKTLGRAGAGTGLIALGYKLAESGTIKPTYSSNRGVNDREEATGNTPGSIVLNGQTYKLQDSPAGQLLILGATLYSDQKEGKRPKDLPGSMAKNAAKQFLDTPMVQGAQDAIEFAKDPEGKGAGYFAGAAGSFVPTIVSDVAAATDDKERAARTATEGVMKRVPGLRQQLPAKSDVLGRDIKFSDWGLVFPQVGQKPRTDPLSKELVRLRVGIQKPNRIRDPKEDLFDRNEADYQNRIRYTGEKVRVALERLIANPGYQKLTDDQKKTKIQEEVKKAKAQATQELKASRAKAPAPK